MTDYSDLNYEQLDDNTTPEGHKSGFVAVIGRPNVGKSTLINRLLRQKIAIVSPKPQTTRVQQLGILSQDDAQIIFVDTPGLHKPQHKLGDFMVGIAQQALRDADVILFLVEVNALPGAGDRIIAGQIKQAATETPVLLALNKADLADADSLQRHVDAYTALVEPGAWQAISALHGDGVDALLAQIITLLPEGPRLYPPDMITEANMRNLAAEMVREQVFLLTHEEVPHAAAVEVDEYVERSETQAYIRATIYVERDSHKSILIGKNGQMLKQIGQAARAEIERLAGINVYLDLWVKVLKNWRKDERMLRRFGYRLGK